ncbi:MAG: type IV toxin-antitoxin system AbiEi family antitoxin domain-containing protein [Actinomycetota bacterium]
MKNDQKLIAVASRQGMIVTTTDALRLVSADTWRRARDQGLWMRVAPGRYRHAATPLTFEMEARAGTAWLGTRGALFGSAALHWLGVEVPQPARAEFLVPRSMRSIPSWLTVHTSQHWSNDDVIRHRGVRTCTATRAIIDFGAQGATARQLEQAIDDAIRLRRTALARLMQRLPQLSGKGRSGCALLRELLLDSGGESHLERRFLRLLRQNGLPPPECQAVFKKDGVTVARVDFLLRAANIVVEVSGRRGHTSDADRRTDARRRNQLQERGLVVLEFTTADVIDAPDYVLTTLWRHLHVVR